MVFPHFGCWGRWPSSAAQWWADRARQRAIFRSFKKKKLSTFIKLWINSKTGKQVDFSLLLAMFFMRVVCVCVCVCVCVSGGEWFHCMLSWSLLYCIDHWRVDVATAASQSTEQGTKTRTLKWEWAQINEYLVGSFPLPLSLCPLPSPPLRGTPAHNPRAVPPTQILEDRSYIVSVFWYHESLIITVMALCIVDKMPCHISRILVTMWTPRMIAIFAECSFCVLCYSAFIIFISDWRYSFCLFCFFLCHDLHFGRRQCFPSLVTICGCECAFN